MTGLFSGPRVRVVPDPALRVTARPVVAFDDALHRLVEDMFAVMHAAAGVGLAANQIGVDLAVFVMDCGGVRAAVVNPVLAPVRAPLPGAPSWQNGTEGCLSLPGEHRPRERAFAARVLGQDPDGRPLDVEETGLVARCLQHETDHLLGRLFTDPVRR